jgi:hypothetical protein
VRTLRHGHMDAIFGQALAQRLSAGPLVSLAPGLCAWSKDHGPNRLTPRILCRDSPRFIWVVIIWWRRTRGWPPYPKLPHVMPAPSGVWGGGYATTGRGLALAPSFLRHIKTFTLYNFKHAIFNKSHNGALVKASPKALGWCWSWVRNPWTPTNFL